MPGKRIRPAQIQAVKALTADRKRTVKVACAEVGILPGSFYRAKARDADLLFPAVQADWTRLTSTYIPLLPKKTPAAVTRDVQEETGRMFGRVYGRPAGTKTAKAVTRDGARFAKALERIVLAYDCLDHQTLHAVEIAAMTAESVPDIRFDEAMAILARVADGFGARIAEAADVDTSSRGRGGRMFDTRTRTAASLLADIYASHMGKTPTAWRKAGLGLKPASAFQHFAHHAFGHFLGDEAPSPHAVDDALTWTARHIDRSDEAAGTLD